MDSGIIKLLVIGVFLAISAVSGWMKKRREAEQQRNLSRGGTTPAATQGRPNQPAPPPVAPRPARPTSWEEELRRLLEGDSPTAPPRPAPPPVVVTPLPRPMTPPPVRPAVVVSKERTAYTVPTARPVVVRVQEVGPAPLPVPTVTSIGSRDLATMSQSRQAYEKASQLDQQMSAHIDRVAGQHVQMTHVIYKQTSPQMELAAAMFKNAAAARQAVIASLVLGPPRALEDSRGVV